MTDEKLKCSGHVKSACWFSGSFLKDEWKYLHSELEVPDPRDRNSKKKQYLHK